MKTFITALCCLSAVPAALASPAACVTGTYASYLALSGGCSIGDATFTSFSNLSFVNSPGVSPLASSEILVTPSGGPTGATLNFVYLNSAGAVTPVTVNQLGQIFSFGLSFQVLVSPSALTGIEMDSAFSNTAPASVSATKTAQLMTGGPTVTSTVSDGGQSNVAGTYSGTLMPVSGVGTFLITDTTSLQAQSGSATESGFINSFELASSTAQTPEIGSLAMIGSGLIGLGLVSTSTRKRTRSRS